jgi:hypothetical protein
MTTKHLSEQEIQQYALDKSGCDKNITGHVEVCKNCQANVEAYLQLFSAISEQRKPAFSFDLSALVLEQLPKPESKFSKDGFYIYVLGFVALALIAIILYSARSYLSKIFTGILPMTMYLITISAITILIFQSIEMYRKYQKQMNALN